MQEIESKWVNHRFDKVVMAKFGMPWSDVHRYVRQKDLFVAKAGKDLTDEERYVKKQTNYKLAFGDILCISDYLLKVEKNKERVTKRQKGPPDFSKDKSMQLADKFREMIVFENANVMVIDKPCGVPSQMGSGLDPWKTQSVDILANKYLEDKNQVETEVGEEDEEEEEEDV